MTKFDIMPLRLALFVCMVCMCIGIPANRQYKCQAHYHVGEIIVEGCDILKVPGKMCKGLCKSSSYPKLKKNNFSELAVSEEEGTRTAVEEDTSEDTESLELTVNGENTCPMCLPRKTIQKTVRLRCKKERKEEMHWEKQEDDDEYERREHTIDVVEDCECKQVSCAASGDMKELYKSLRSHTSAY